MGERRQGGYGKQLRESAKGVRMAAEALKPQMDLMARLIEQHVAMATSMRREYRSLLDKAMDLEVHAAEIEREERMVGR